MTIGEFSRKYAAKRTAGKRINIYAYLLTKSSLLNLVSKLFWNRKTSADPDRNYLNYSMMLFKQISSDNERLLMQTTCETKWDEWNLDVIIVV